MKKKSPLRAVIWLVFLFCVAGFAGWILLAPQPPARHKTVHVKVEHPPLPEERPEPQQQAEQPPESPVQESEQKLAVVTAPVMPEREAPPPGHKPEIAIIIDDMGLNLSGSKRAIKLPAPVTLSYIPYADRLDEQTTVAREAGHELMLHMPMEPIGRQDPGPGALLTTLGADEVRRRFVHALDSFDGFDGVNNHMGSRFTSYPAGMQIVMDELQKRHLFFVDSRTSPQSIAGPLARKRGIPTVSRDVFLDDDMSPSAVKAQLAITERIARRRGHALAIGHPHEVTLQALEEWIPEAERQGFVFVPVHDLVRESGVIQVNTP